jgi:hypothetical protein
MIQPKLYRNEACYKLITSYKKDQQRYDIENFINDNFFVAYKANLKRFADTIIACINTDNQYLATLGFNKLKKNKKSFVEYYLDEAIEIEIAKKIKQPILREQIIELANLSATRRGATRDLIQTAIPTLKSMGAKWVFCVANKIVYNSFLKEGLKPILLGPAIQERIKDYDPKTDWGSYYQLKPNVYFIKVPD